MKLLYINTNTQIIYRKREERHNTLKKHYEFNRTIGKHTHTNTKLNNRTQVYISIYNIWNQQQNYIPGRQQKNKHQIPTGHQQIQDEERKRYHMPSKFKRQCNWTCDIKPNKQTKSTQWKQHTLAKKKRVRNLLHTFLIYDWREIN